MKLKTTLILGAIGALLRLTPCEATVSRSVDFEGSIPNFIEVSDASQIEISDLRYKDGSNSLLWSWGAPGSLTISDSEAIAQSTVDERNGINMWIYNETATPSDTRFSFCDDEGEERFYFNFNMDFVGWRVAYIKYIDMYPDGGSREGATKLVVNTPEGVDSGRIFIDRFSLHTKPLNSRTFPDKQIPTNNRNAGTTPLWHWCRVWEWECFKYPYEVSAIDAEQSEMLESVEQRITHTVEVLIPQNQEAAALMAEAKSMFEGYGIKRDDDGVLSGAPILGCEEYVAGGNEFRNTQLSDMLLGFALDFLNNGNAESGDRFFLLFDFAIDQGFAYGCGLGADHHYGYQVAPLYNAVWLMRDEITARGRRREYADVARFWSGLGESRIVEIEHGRDQMIDTWHTLLLARTMSAMLYPTREEQYRAMMLHGEWVSNSLKFMPGTAGGIKPDGSLFHHGGLYPAYSNGTLAALGTHSYITGKTDFALTLEARENIRLALNAMRNYTNLRDWSISVAGRHPLGDYHSCMGERDVVAFGQLATTGDFSGSGNDFDHQLAADYLRLGGFDDSLTQRFTDAGIEAAAAPEGFFVMNYGALGILRRDDWMVNLKGYNSDVWCAEIYVKDNRYGRYQSYGTAPIIGSGNPVTAYESGFSQSGWDWNRPPGATTVHLPYEKLDGPNDIIMELNVADFSGASSLEGRNGAFAFHLIERDRDGFIAGATAKKSIFCFDNKMVFLGSDISNDSEYPTETTLYQLRLDEPSDAVMVDGGEISEFPYHYNKRVKRGARRLISDNKGNYYAVKGESELHVVRQTQSSPHNKTREISSDDFVTAYLNHGASPEAAGYEYVVYVQPEESQVASLRKSDDDYRVLRRDGVAHIVRDEVSGITGYVCWEEYSSASGFVRSVSGETIVMERAKGDGSIVISICSPDLALSEDKSMRMFEGSKTIIKRVTLAGTWDLAEGVEGLTVEHRDGNTTLTASCLHGLPLEAIVRINSKF